MWLLVLESVASLIWIVALAGSLLIAALGTALGGEDLLGFGLAWGIAIAAVASLQLIVALMLERSYEPGILRVFLLAALYPPRVSPPRRPAREIIALLRGPSRQRVVWDIQGDQLETAPRAAKGPPSQNR